jgi:hypothetical protein
MDVQPSQVLGAMITPAVLISAVALLLLSTANRLSRVIDRISSAINLVQHSAGQAATIESNRRRRDLALRQLKHLMHRLLLLRAAITGIYLTIGLLLLTSITAGLNILIPGITRWLPISLGMLGAASFLYCIVVLIREALIAVHATLEDVKFLHDMLGQP